MQIKAWTSPQVASGKEVRYILSCLYSDKLKITVAFEDRSAALTAMQNYIIGGGVLRAVVDQVEVTL